MIRDIDQVDGTRTSILQPNYAQSMIQDQEVVLWCIVHQLALKFSNSTESARFLDSRSE